MLYREIIAVCSEIHTKHINTVCGQNVDLFKSLKRGGKYSNHCGLKRHCLIVLYSNKYFWQLPSTNIPYKVAGGPLVQIQLRGEPKCAQRSVISTRPTSRKEQWLRDDITSQ
jgi:hypothetical protein